jgi:hypothetical protein
VPGFQKPFVAEYETLQMKLTRASAIPKLLHDPPGKAFQPSLITPCYPANPTNYGIGFQPVAEDFIREPTGDYLLRPHSD